MKHASLAAHYRPQTFAEVTGQDMITTVLSRAAAEDRVAAAYLLSGTRGVGKTTIARILAKALNCVNAPTAEPCNQCSNCQMITKGNHVDVTEIDGASNNSVEDARALRENIGYAPMEGRYKVFIIDEAHMLSRSAFNALLKTLEEPPPRVVFIFATTEVHKFPITIVSRCQHFIFKRLSEEGLVAHLSRVLNKEGVDFDPQAVRTIARRANGSVRDSMSLLGQTLALGDATLTMEGTRSVLGLAGQELFMSLMEAIAEQNCPAVIELMQKLSDQGIDIGFFLRELINLWRTLFLLREAGKAILPSLGLSEEESTLWLTLAAKFSAAHLHAAWHMTLDAQRKVIHSPEPAAALELLLINLTLMPRLLPLHAAQPVASDEAEKKNSANPVSTAPEQQFSQQAQTQRHAPLEQESQHMRPTGATNSANMHENTMPEPPSYVSAPVHPAQVQAQRVQPNHMAPPQPMQNQTEPPQSAQNPPWQRTAPHAPHAPQGQTLYQASTTHTASPAPVIPQDATETTAPTQATPLRNTPLTWEAVREHLATQQPPVIPDIFLQQATGSFEDGALHIHTKSTSVYAKIEHARVALQDALQSVYGNISLHIHKPVKTLKTEAVLLEEFNAREDLKDCLEILDASIYKVRPLHDI